MRLRVRQTCSMHNGSVACCPSRLEHNCNYKPSMFTLAVLFAVQCPCGLLRSTSSATSTINACSHRPSPELDLVMVLAVLPAVQCLCGTLQSLSSATSTTSACPHIICPKLNLNIVLAVLLAVQCPCGTLPSTSSATSTMNAACMRPSRLVRRGTGSCTGDATSAGSAQVFSNVCWMPVPAMTRTALQSRLIAGHHTSLNPSRLLC